MAENYIDVIVRAVDKATATLKNVGQSTRNMASATDSSTAANNRNAQSFSVLKTAAVAFAAVALVKVGKDLIKIGNDIETLQVRFKVLFGSAAEGAKAFQLMSDYASTVPFSLEQIQAGSGSLAVVSKDAEEMAQLMEITGNVAGATGLDFRTASEQIQRAMAGGIASADMFREKGVRNMLGFKEGVNVSVEETRERFAQVFANGGEFSTASAELAKTFSGTLSMIGDSVFNLKRNIIDEFFPTLKKHMMRLQKFFKDNEKELKQVAQTIGVALAGAIDILASAVEFLADNWDLVIVAFKILIALSLVKFFTGLVTVIRTFTISTQIAAVATSALKGGWVGAGLTLTALVGSYALINTKMEEFIQNSKDAAAATEAAKAAAAPTDDDEEKDPTYLQARAAEAFAGIKEGAKTALGEWNQSTQEVFSTASQAITSSLTGAVDSIGTAFGEMLTEGKSFKESMSAIWKDLKKQVIMAIAQMMVKMLAMIALGLILNTLLPGLGLTSGATGVGIPKLEFAKGGITNALDVPSFAQGGITNAPQLALIGDNSNNREAVVPLPNGRSIPVDMQGSGMQSIGQLNILPNASIDEALMNQPMSYWEDLVQQKILPAINTLGEQGETISTEFRSQR
tara:strand:- start:904 stop:2787 length:1884 start_codon:yes stop_codon:yes gene_type:complete